MNKKSSSLKRKFFVLSFLGFFFFVFFLSSFVFAQTNKKDENKSIITLPWKNPAQKPVPPSFILPRQNRWGCLACHSNKRLSKFRDGKEVSLFVDPEVIGNSMHEKIACLDCHTNFSYETHPATTPQDFRKVAGLACMSCHPYQAYVYKNSIHGRLTLEGKLGKVAGKKVEPPLCSSCHGFHDIQTTRFEPYRSKFRASLREGKVCTQCHLDRYQSWEDYYHGKGYKAGAKDAPTCWDCHSNHLILKAKDSASTVNEKKLPQTCAKCHDRPTVIFTSYAPLIHGREKLMEENLVVRIFRFFVPKGKKEVEVVSLPPEEKTKPIVKQEESFFSRLYNFFFPRTLRPEKR